jgi:hypothetical protein
MGAELPELARPALPDWPRLMGEPMAAEYLSIGVTTLRERGPAPKRFGRRRLYDRHDLDRWADRLGGQPLDARAEQEEADEVERRFMERRRGHG